MEQAILILSNIYNFIPCNNTPPITIHLQLLDQFYQIHQLFTIYFHNDIQYPKDMFVRLEQFISQEEQVFGPKKFNRMIEGISTVIVQYILIRLRENAIDKAVLCLTYYERSCSKYFTEQVEIVILMIYALAHLKKQSLNIAEQYLNSSHQILMGMEKNKSQTNVYNLRIMQSMFEGMSHQQKGNYSKAKCIFSEVISKITTKIHDEQCQNKKITAETQYYFVLVTYLMSQVYTQMGMHDISAYNLTQCLQFAAQHLEHSSPLIEKFTSNSQFLMRKTVKLSRIQNKIERIKSLHSLNSLIFKGEVTSDEEKKKKTATFKISRKTKDSKLSDNQINRELKQLYILDQNNEAKLRRRTLKVLKAERIKKQKKINAFKQEIHQFSQEKQQIQHQFQNQLQQTQIQSIEKEKQALKNQIYSQIWQVVGTLKPTKKIQSYLQCFKTYLSYETNNKFTKFICSSVSLKSYLKLFAYFRKYKSKMVREMIRTVVLNKIKHQIQFLIHKTDIRYFIKIYQIQSGLGINQEMETTQKIHEELKKVPLNYFYQIVPPKLIPLQTYIESLPQNIICFVKMFARRLKNRILSNRQQLKYKKFKVNITFNTYHTQLMYTIFSTTTKAPQGKYQHKIERIDLFKYKNKDYNLKLNTVIISNYSQLFTGELVDYITQQIIAKKRKYQNLIVRIQNMFRIKLSVRIMKNKKNQANVSTVIINSNLFTLVQHGNTRHFYIQSFYGEYHVTCLKYVDFNNLAFINKLRPELSEVQNCNLQLEIVKKYFRLRQFAHKLIKKSKQVKLDTKFQTKFKKSLCFAKIMKQFLYKGKYFNGRVMYMLTVKNFEQFPRPYCLRVFTMQHQTLFSIDFDKTIYNSQKIFLQQNLDKINSFIDIHGIKTAYLLMQGPAKSLPKSKRSNSKSTILSNYTFGSGDQFLKEIPRSRMNSRLVQGRQSHILSRNKKNSINFKMRHKSALKQKDIQMIKKWIQDSKGDSSISQSSESSQS